MFQVGDIVRLDGEGWKQYCSTPLWGREFEVREVEADGRGVVPIIPAREGGYYMAWVSPDPLNHLYGVVVSR